jgi:hypothetical protein
VGTGTELPENFMEFATPPAEFPVDPFGGFGGFGGGGFYGGGFYGGGGGYSYPKQYNPLREQARGI